MKGRNRISTNDAECGVDPTLTLLAGCTFNIFDDLLARALGCLSHRPLLGGDDEPETLTYQIRLVGPIGVDPGK
jgi:hypothetical protein